MHGFELQSPQEFSGTLKQRVAVINKGAERIVQKRQNMITNRKGRFHMKRLRCILPIFFMAVLVMFAACGKDEVVSAENFLGDENYGYLFADADEIFSAAPHAAEETTRYDFFQLLRLVGNNISEAAEVFGEVPELASAASGVYVHGEVWLYVEIENLSRILMISMSPDACEIDGAALDVNREGLIDIFGVPVAEWYDEEGGPYSYGLVLDFEVDGNFVRFILPASGEGAGWMKFFPSRPPQTYWRGYTPTIQALTEEASQYEIMQLTDADFEISYDGFTIRRNTTPADFQNNLGLPENHSQNNYGNISTGNGFRRWQLSYPEHGENWNARIIFLSVQEIDANGNEYHGDTYMVGISLNGIETHRGLGVGDSLDRIFQLYGQPSAIENYRAISDLNMLVYEHVGNRLEIILDEASRVKYIFINFQMERSVEDQFGELCGCGENHTGDSPLRHPTPPMNILENHEINDEFLNTFERIHEFTFLQFETEYYGTIILLADEVVRDFSFAHVGFDLDDEGKLIFHTITSLFEIAELSPTEAVLLNVAFEHYLHPRGGIIFTTENGDEMRMFIQESMEGGCHPFYHLTPASSEFMEWR
jgi:hypothetical protein